MMLREDQESFAVWKSVGFSPAFISGVGLFLIDLKKDHHADMEHYPPYLCSSYHWSECC